VKITLQDKILNIGVVVHYGFL